MLCNVNIQAYEYSSEYSQRNIQKCARLNLQAAAGAPRAAEGGGSTREQVCAQLGALQMHAMRALDASAGALVRELEAPAVSVAAAAGMEVARTEKVWCSNVEEPQQQPARVSLPPVRLQPPLIHL